MPIVSSLYSVCEIWQLIVDFRLLIINDRIIAPEL